MTGFREKLAHPVTDVLISLYQVGYLIKEKAESSSSYLNDSNDISEAAFEEVAVNEHAKGETSAAVAVDQLAYEPRTWGGGGGQNIR